MNRYRKLNHALFHHKQIGLIVFAAVLALAAYPAWRVWAAAGDLDTSFSSDGKKEDLPLSLTALGKTRTAIQADGKLLVLKTAVVTSVSCNNSGVDFELVRLNLNGSLDTSFDFDGKVTTNFGACDHAADLALQPDGKIVVAGVSGDPFNGGKNVLARYLPNGSLDSSFSGDGKAYGIDYTSAKEVELQSNGKIIVYGFSVYPGPPPPLLVRFNANGTVDTTFGDGTPAAGYTRLPLTCSPNSGAMNPDKLRIQNDNKLIVTGLGTLLGTVSCLKKLTANGQPEWEAPSQNFTSMDVALQANGKILLLGLTGMRRFNQDGTLDTSFGINGDVATTGADHWNQALVIQEDGRLVVAGSGKPSTYRRGRVCRYLSDGTADISFSSQQGCRATTFSNLPNNNVHFNNVLLYADDRIVAAGAHGDDPFYGSSNNTPVIARYKNDDTDTQTTDVAIGTITHSPTAVYPSTVVTYSIPVKNNSATKAAHVRLTTNVPSNTIFFGLVLPAGWAALVKPSPGGMGTISCAAYELAPNTTATIQVQVLVSAMAYWGQTISLAANVSNTIPDTTLNNLGVKVVTVQ